MRSWIPFSFQALGFDQKLGYTKIGRICGFSGKQERHYLYKSLVDGGLNGPEESLRCQN
jgi:hypothetical protein